MQCVCVCHVSVCIVCGYYVGFVEALVNNLGVGGSLLHGESPKSLHCAKIGCLHLTVWILELSKAMNIPPHVFTGNEGIPVNYWYNILYGTGVLLFCLIVCLVGASEFHFLSISIIITL